jgi:hypothetical protein
MKYNLMPIDFKKVKEGDLVRFTYDPSLSESTTVVGFVTDHRFDGFFLQKGDSKKQTMIGDRNDSIRDIYLHNKMDNLCKLVLEKDQRIF